MSINFILAQIFGALALTAVIISFQKNKKSFLIKIQILSNLLYSVQYLLLGAYTGGVLSGLCILRNFIFSRYDKKVPIIWLIIVLLFMIVFSIITFEGFVSFYPIVAIIVYTIALWSGNLKAIRATEAIGCSLMIIYSIQVSAYTGLISSCIELTSAFSAIYKFDLKDKERKLKIYSDSTTT